MMTNKHGTTHVTPADGNIFLDLGHDPKTAAKMLAETDRAIDRKLALKAELMKEISTWIEQERLTQDVAAGILGCTRPRVSDIVNKKSPKFTIDALIGMLSRAGKEVRFSVR